MAVWGDECRRAVQRVTIVHYHQKAYVVIIFFSHLDFQSSKYLCPPPPSQKKSYLCSPPPTLWGIRWPPGCREQLVRQGRSNHSCLLLQTGAIYQRSWNLHCVLVCQRAPCMWQDPLSGYSTGCRSAREGWSISTSRWWERQQPGLGSKKS